LYGFLEQLHTLTASAVDKVANDLREEIAVVASPSALPAVDAATSALGAAFPAFVERLAALEKNVDQHDRLLRRAIEIAAHYFQSERP
jgi:hypothetical protein